MILEFPQFAYDILSIVLDQKEKQKEKRPLAIEGATSRRSGASASAAAAGHTTADESDAPVMLPPPPPRSSQTLPRTPSERGPRSHRKRPRTSSLNVD